MPLFKKKSDYKIFCIGFFKTGTTSLCKAFNILGYRSAHLLRGGIEPKEGWLDYIKKCKYDAYTDKPFADIYQQLDEAFPNSKFVLTVRDKQSLVKSHANYFEGTPNEIKTPQELERLMQKYEKHNREVIEYFKNKPSQLLVMNIFEEDGWEKLCSFLNKPAPNRSFPNINKGRYKK
jgi:hypothetical protein